ncbi:transcriptional regulator with XRE-family HTH domain [Pseudomonas lurida]
MSRSGFIKQLRWSFCDEWLIAISLSGQCVMFRIEKTERLKENIKYLIKSRGETQLSLCNSSGVTRTTIYNILEGRVVNVQQSTIRRISDFFGVSYKEIETVDFQAREVLEGSIALQGNRNPAAVPVIKESVLVQSLDKKIGELVATQPLTYYFGAACNVIGVLLENAISDVNDSGDLLIVKKGPSHSDKDKLVYNTITHTLFITSECCVDSNSIRVIGDIIEERFNG